MKINIHELAAKEFDEAIEWYELHIRFSLHQIETVSLFGPLRICIENRGTGNQE